MNEIPTLTSTYAIQTYDPSQPVKYVHRIGLHHFAYLRAIAQALDPVDCAKRYLGIEHAHEAKNAHFQTVSAVRAIARRRGERTWRLIGLAIKINKPIDQDNKVPSLEEFIDVRGLDGWSESEVIEMYQEAYPPDKKSISRQRTRELQFQLIRRLEELDAETPQLTDLIAGWFDSTSARKLVSAGMLTLQDLAKKIDAGGRWFSTMPGVGVVKAKMIESLLDTLVPDRESFTAQVFSLTHKTSVVLTSNEFSALGNSNQPIQSNPSRLLLATNDIDAINTWINAKAASKLTAKSYRREAERLVLWLRYERYGTPLSRMSVEDCNAYMNFLEDIPARWISKARAKPGQMHWAPFKGQLSHSSRIQAVVTIAGMFNWLQSAMYISADPWTLVNQKLKKHDPNAEVLLSKAFSDLAFDEVLKYIAAQPPSSRRHRIDFIFRFVGSVGLRSTELLNAKLKDLRQEPEGLMLHVHGKGSRNRICQVRGQSFRALETYLKSRGIEDIFEADPELPILASTVHLDKPIQYQALYETVRSWVSRAMAASSLTQKERLKFSRASTHWLRHTFGTNAVAKGVPPDVIQAQMGHSSIETTINIYGRAPVKRNAEEMAKAFD